MSKIAETRKITCAKITTFTVVWSSQSVIPGSPKVNISKELINIAADFGLEQVVDKPSRGNRILDLFFTTTPTLVIKSTVAPGISDHDGIQLWF